MTGNSRRDQLNAEILESVSELIGRVIAHGEQLAQKLSIPAPFIKALHTMDCPMAMKELGKRMHCDPSFVTLIADMLEKRGLARREPHPADRRVKNLVLTEDGLSLKERLETEISARMPWNRALNDDERAQLLALIRKMLSAEDNGARASDKDTSAAVILTAAGIDPLGTLKEVLSTGKQEPAAHVHQSSPPA
jgi:MarR family transcriptional regulator, organic hydroperoxide resistance regulator